MLQQQASQPVEQPSQPQAAKKRVLVVEDDPSSRAALQYLLQRAGCEVSVTENLVQSFAMFAPGKTAIDAVVLDLMLPDGDGVTLLEHIRRTSPHTRVIVATGVLDETWIQRVQAHSPTSILRKPIMMAELITLL